jgi:hypothetical protein
VIKLRRLRWARHVACLENKRDIYRVIEGKPGEKRQLGRPRGKQENNIKMQLQKVG